MRDIPTFESGSDDNCLITDINHAYAIHIKPELINYPDLEKSLLKFSKHHIGSGIFQQMKDSQWETYTHDQLKAHPIAM